MSKWDKYLVAGTSPVLKTRCREVEAGESVARTCEIMQGVCCHGTRKGVGLAAPQIGAAVRLIFVNCRDEKNMIRKRFLLNPVITGRSDTTNIEREGCLSFPGRQKAIARPDWVDVEYETPERAKRQLHASGYHARVICHECDHLDGICRVGDDSPDDE